MPSQRQSITVSVVLLGLLVPIFIPLPSQEVATKLLGSELALGITGSSVLGLLLVLLVGAGGLAFETPTRAPLIHRLTYWPAPAALIAIGLLYLPFLTWWGYQVVWVILVGLLLALVFSLQVRAASASATAPVARGLLTVLVYVEAFILFSLFYGTRARSILSAGGILVVSAALAAELLRGATEQRWGAWLYALLVGLLVSELTWALNYWSIDARLGGGFLLLVFYTLTGITQQHLGGGLTRRMVLEYATLCLAGFALLALSRLLPAL